MGSSGSSLSASNRWLNQILGQSAATHWNPNVGALCPGDVIFLNRSKVQVQGTKLDSTPTDLHHPYPTPFFGTPNHGFQVNPLMGSREIPVLGLRGTNLFALQRGYLLGKHSGKQRGNPNLESTTPEVANRTVSTQEPGNCAWTLPSSREDLQHSSVALCHSHLTFQSCRSDSCREL